MATPDGWSRPEYAVVPMTHFITQTCRRPSIGVLATLALALGLLPAVASAADGASPSPVPEPSDTPVIDLGQPFTLLEGETVVVDQVLGLSFLAVTQDSRCPADVQCVWEGNASVQVEASVRTGPPVVLCLNTNPRFETAATYGEFVIELLGLEPYPRTTQTMGPYQATLVVNASTQATPDDAISGCGAEAATR